jgi:hypothetical protein
MHMAPPAVRIIVVSAGVTVLLGLCNPPHSWTGTVGPSLPVIPQSEIVETKPPYVCPGCFIHTYNNNMINRFHVQ